MRRQLVFILLLAGLAGLIGMPGPETTIATADPAWAEGTEAVSRQPLTLQPVDPYAFPLSADEAADTCDTASFLENFSENGSGGDRSDVRFMSEDASDPNLSSCTWGNPSRPQGYRTVWYQFQPPHSGIATIETLPSNYDTILAVYTGSCDALTRQACNDDFQGLTSRVELSVSRYSTYYVEVADWQSGWIGEPPSLSLAAVLEPFENRWQEKKVIPQARTRHATAIDGPFLYVLGGMTGRVDEQNLSNEVWRLNTLNNNWVSLPPIPGSAYANGTAVTLAGRIYFPGGYNGSFDDTHHVYNPASNIWGTANRLTNSLPGASPLAFAKAVASKSNALPTGYFLLGGTSEIPTFDQLTEPREPAEPNGTTYYYLVDQNRWSNSLFPPLNAARFAHVAAWVGGRVCVAGGVGADDEGNNILLIDGECYTPGGGGWVPTGPMQTPRYNAASAVGPDGLWYVYGGVDGGGNVARTEVYNPATNSWRALDEPYNLGTDPDLLEDPDLPRAWPQGGRIGETIWAVGGNNDQGQSLFLVESLEIATPELYIPIVFYQYGAVTPPNDTFATAYPLPRNTPRVENFDGRIDFHDTYFFDLPQTQVVEIKLRDIPSGADYDLILNNSNKLRLGSSRNVGSQSEQIAQTLIPGRYYLMIERIYPGDDPPDQPYTLIVRDR